MDRVSYAMRLVGTRVGGKYVLHRVLGIGGMGTVYEAHHAYTNRRVALKVLGPDHASSHDAVVRFLQEAQAPSSIGHPNIVEVLDAGEDEALGLYVVLEFLEGEDLESAIEHGAIDMPTLLGVTARLLDALAAAHARGFVHRDIKPANVFLARDRDGATRVKLLDFGIAKNVAQGITVGHAIMGTPHYMAPEQARGRDVDARADLWSVGAMLYHAFAGVPPYDGENANVIMVNILTGASAPLRALRPDLSAPLLDLVDRALLKDPSARWASAQDMAAQLARVPELHGAVAAKLSSTLRNRDGASHAAPDPHPTARDAPAPTTAPPAVRAPLASGQVAAALVRRRSSVRRLRAPTALAAALAVVGVVVAVAMAASRHDAPRPAPVARPTPAPQVIAPVVEPPPLPAAPADDAGVAASDPPRREHRRGRRRAHDDAPSQPPPRMGGLTIGDY